MPKGPLAFGFKPAAQLFDKYTNPYAQQDYTDPYAQQKLANEELLRNLQQQIYIDQARLAGSNYPIYQGKKVAPLSDLTQNARTMRAQYAGKVPKQGKIEALLKQEAKGFSPEQMQNMLDVIRRGDTSERLVLDRLQKEFGKNFGYSAGRENRLKGKIGKDIEHDLKMSASNLQNISDELAQLEGKRTTVGVNALQKAAVLKGMGRESLMGQLENFGNQKHAFDNLKIRADRDAFEEEAMAPYRKINKANAALAGIDAEEMHPDKAKVNNALLQKVQNAYNAPYAAYPGSRVVPMNPEVEESFRLTQQISPKYKDVYAQERKNIERNLLENPVSTQIYNKLPETVEPLMLNLDKLSKRQFKKIAGDVSGQFARQGTYGSGAHMGALEKALREAAHNVQAEKEGALLSGLKGQRQLVAHNEENALNKYGLMAEEGAKELGSLLDKYNRKNKTGWEKTQNEQGKENEAIQAWYGQTASEWPKLQNAISGSAYDAAFPQGRNDVVGPFAQSAMAKGYGENLAELFKQPALFDENEKAYNAYQQKAIVDRESAQRMEREAALLRAQQEAAMAAMRRALPAPASQVQAPRATNNSQQETIDRAWNNYNNATQLYRRYHLPGNSYSPQTGIYTAEGKANLARADKLTNYLAKIPGMSGQAPSNLGLTRADFADPSKFYLRHWANYNL